MDWQLVTDVNPPADSNTQWWTYVKSAGVNVGHLAYRDDETGEWWSASSSCGTYALTVQPTHFAPFVEP